MKLVDHRKMIEKNPIAYTKDFKSDRLTGTFKNQPKDWKTNLLLQ